MRLYCYNASASVKCFLYSDLSVDTLYDYWVVQLWCCVQNLKQHRHTDKLNTFTLTFEAWMFVLFTVRSLLLPQMKVIYVNIEIIQSQNICVNLDYTVFEREKNH